MHLSQLPISSSGLTIKSPRASVSAVISAPNKAVNHSWCIRRLPSFVDEIGTVGRRSRDHTVDVARALRVDVVVVEQRRGKGVAVRAGLATASGNIVVMLDADGSIDPQESAGVSPRFSMTTTCRTGRGRGGSAPSEFHTLNVGRMKT